MFYTVYPSSGNSPKKLSYQVLPVVWKIKGDNINEDILKSLRHILLVEVQNGPVSMEQDPAELQRPLPFEGPSSPAVQQSYF